MNRITELFNINYPIIQAGMVWCSGWRLASAVSNAGGLGLIGSGSMYPDTLKQHIERCFEATSRPFGVNVPLLYPDVEKHMQVIVESGVRIVFTSAGNPKIWTPVLQQHGITVVHVVSSLKFAQKSEEAGVDAVVAEGFEAGGHNGRDETTTFCLLPLVAEHVKVPVIGAGGIASGKTMLAAMILGAEGVQIGTRFAVSVESSAHETFKQKVIEAQEGDTQLLLKKLAPVRMIKNAFAYRVIDAEEKGADSQKLLELLGKGRAKAGIYEGNLDEGELEIGQVSASVDRILPAAEILHDIWREYIQTRQALCIDYSTS